MLALVVAVQSRLWARSSVREEAGQATAEYAIVLLGAAGLALLLIKWATKTGLIGHLLEMVINTILGKINIL